MTVAEFCNLTTVFFQVSAKAFEVSVGRTTENADHCHPELLMFKLLSKADIKNESGFGKSQYIRDSQVMGNEVAADKNHMYVS